MTQDDLKRALDKLQESKVETAAFDGATIILLLQDKTMITLRNTAGPNYPTIVTMFKPPVSQ